MALSANFHHCSSPLLRLKKRSNEDGHGVAEEGGCEEEVVEVEPEGGWGEGERMVVMVGRRVGDDAVACMRSEYSEEGGNARSGGSAFFPSLPECTGRKSFVSVVDDRAAFFFVFSSSDGGAAVVAGAGSSFSASHPE